MADILLETPGFRKVISHDRFRFLMRYLHFADCSQMPARGTAEYDPIFWIRPILDYLNVKFLELYIPERPLCVDEGLVGMKNRNPAMQYLPSKKHHRWRVKLYLLAEVGTGYTLRVCVHNPRDQKLYEQMPESIEISKDHPDAVDAEQILNNLGNLD